MGSVSLENIATLARYFEEAGEGMSHGQAKTAAETNAVLSCLLLLIASEAIACVSANNGMPWNESYALTAKVMAETASLLSDNSVHPAQLKDMVCQPGGFAIDVMQALEHARLRVAMIDACNEAVKHTTHQGEQR